MGEVYCARDTKLDRDVALKALLQAARFRLDRCHTGDCQPYMALSDRF